MKIIGIHKGYKETWNKNIGIYMKEIINNLNEENIINRNETNSISINNNEKLKKEEKDNKKNLINSKSLPKLKDKQNEKEIDIDYYSRHICTFGLETKKKLMKMKVLIVGLRGLGEEIAKNTILFGVNEVQIYDSEIFFVNGLCPSLQSEKIRGAQLGYLC